MKVTKTLPPNSRNKLDSAVVNTVDYNFGSSLEESVDLFGSTAVFEAFVDAAQVKLRSFMSSKMVATSKDGAAVPTGISDDELQLLVDDWKVPAGGARRASPKEKSLNLLAQMSNDEIAAYLEARRNL